MYRAGALRTLGRVDHGDAFLDTDAMERERGITIFSKQARLSWKGLELTLLDTPGHVDFSAEMERTLGVLDYALLVVSGSDGVQGHTKTLWELLKAYGIPTFLFINKMDQPDTDRTALLARLKKELDDGCVDMDDGEGLAESAALCDEGLMERYLEGEPPGRDDIAALIARRQLFPCLFGSALRVEGVDELLDALAGYTLEPDWPEGFAARVFKISRDERGERLTWLKVTGGTLKVRTPLSAADWEEKVNQIRLYSGVKFQPAEEAPAGTVCAVTGLTRTFPGQGLGGEQGAEGALLEPVLTYRLLLEEGCDVHTLLGQLRRLEEEEPQLGVVWNPRLGELSVRVMGPVQLEILQRQLRGRFGVEAAFDAGGIVYRETIAAPVEGVGHFEPLRHYAEVHLLLEPLERGSGLVLDSACPEDVLDRNWQRLIFTHLLEKEHLGVLTGSPITDMKLTLLTGKSHKKHTEGGDFRQATYRAVRQGLMSAQSVLLEPWYAFRLELPSDCVGRAMTDVQRMGGSFDAPDTAGELALLTGTAPVSAMRDYWMELTAYSRGRGRLSCTVDGYRPCHNADEVVAAAGYDPERDVDNPADSVFCSHGAGVTVKWNEVRDHMHLDSGWRPAGEETTEEETPVRPVTSYSSNAALEKELLAIFERTYGPVKSRSFRPAPRAASPKREKPWKGLKPRPAGEEYLLVDGYNIIHAWDELRELAKADLDGARSALTDILRNYQGWRGCHVILVFDAYRVKGNPGSVDRVGNIHVVYTKEAETADMYIEKTTYEIGRKHRVRVATSDALEQMIILGHGAARMSAAELKFEVDQVNAQIRARLN